MLKVGIIGCGRIGCGFDDNMDGRIAKTHAGSYFQNPNTKLVALCDIDKKKLVKYGTKYKVNGLYQNSKKMFKHEKLDCVSICTHADSHYDLVKEAIKFGIKGIFLEKPISNNLQNAKSIIKICQRKNVVLLVNHRRRFDPLYHSLNKLLQQKKIGNIQLINVNYGGGIANTCSHVFDILRMFFGNVKSIYANLSKNSSGNSLDPNLDVAITFRNDIKCHLHAVDTRNYGILELDIYGTKGRIIVDLESNNVNYYKINEKNFLVYKKLIPVKLRLKHSKKSSMSLGVADLVKCLTTKKMTLSGGEDAYRSLELIVASVISAKKSITVKIPLKSSKIP